MENRKYTPCGHEDLDIIKHIWFLDEWVLNIHITQRRALETF